MRVPALALAQRALLLDARGHLPYSLRGLLVALMLVALWTAHEWGRFMGAPGLHVFGWVIHTNFWFITLFGISTFSAVVAEEKENMTLGLLKMAGFGAASILIGKSIGQLLTMLLLLLVQLPFALLAITLGGVSQHQILAAYVLLFAHVLFVYGLALFCSVLASRSGLAARMTGLLLLGYYAVPWLCLTSLRVTPGSGPAGAGTNALLAGTLWVGQNSAWAGLGMTSVTGFDEPLFGTPALVTLAMAATLYALSALAFGPCTRNEVAAAPARGFFGDLLHRGRNRAISRPLGHPLFWKDFQFLCGGGTGLLLRFLSYGLLLLVVHLVMRSRLATDEMGSVTMTIMVLVLLIELGLQANRVFREEITWRTLSALMILPMPMTSWIYAKVAGCLVITLPGLSYFLLGAVMAPRSFGNAVTHLFSNSFGWYALALVVLGLHLIAYLSLRLRRGAFAVGILLIFVVNLVVVLFMSGVARGGGVESCAGILAVMLCAGALAMHPAIGRLVAKKAAE
jgi:ABC-type transport system involved in multi-copper enzyme maturation permease subunit